MSYSFIDRLLFEKVNAYLTRNDQHDDESMCRAVVFYRSHMNNESNDETSTSSIYYSTLVKLLSAHLKLEYHENDEDVSNNLSHNLTRQSLICEDLIDSIKINWFLQDLSDTQVIAMQDWVVLHHLAKAMSQAKSDKALIFSKKLYQLTLTRATHMVSYFNSNGIKLLGCLLQCHVVCMFRDIADAMRNVSLLN
jgi:hypothetical protein